MDLVFSFFLLISHQRENLTEAQDHLLHDQLDKSEYQDNRFSMYCNYGDDWPYAPPDQCIWKCMNHGWVQRCLQ